MQRLNRIVNELDKAATSRGRLPNVGGVMQDLPNTIISFLARTLGARAGAQAGAGTSGASLLTAHFASRRVKDLLHNLTNDRAAMLLRDAIQDPELFRSLLVSADTPQRARHVERRLVEWIGAETRAAVEELRGREAGQSPDDGDWWLHYTRRPQPGAPASEGPRSDLGTIQPAHARVDLDRLEPGVSRRFITLQRRFGRALPVTSAYRSPEHNVRVGGAKRSRHMHGGAIDIDVSGLSMEERLKPIRDAPALGFTGIGVYDDSLHLDMGNRRAWGPFYGRKSVPV